MILLVLLLLCTPFLWWYLTLRKYKSLEKIPGPKPLPLIGNVLDVGNNPQELLKNLSKFCNTYGEVFKVYVGNELKVFIAKPELLEEIMSSNVHITKSHVYDLLKPWLGTGLIISTGNKWKGRRKMITPTFHFKILDEFLKIFNSGGDKLVKILSKEIGKKSCDIYPYLNLCTLDVICETAMGVQIKAQENQHTDYVKAVKGYLDITVMRSFSSWKRFDGLFQFSWKYASQKSFLETLHKFTNGVIKTRREEKSSEKSKALVSEDGIKRKTALLDMLLESENKYQLTNEDIREEIDNFMFAGHDTTTTGISFAILALADNPDAQEKVFQEIQSIIGTEQDVTMHHLQETKYFDMFLKEVQRFYPPVPFIERALETASSIGGFEFPKGTTLSLFIYGLHHSEKYFPEPQKFDPDRFLPEKQSQRHNFAYVPFSAGPRNCIGQKFALLEMKTILIKIVKNFRILPVPNYYKPELGMSGILKSSNGVKVQLQLRN